MRRAVRYLLDAGVRQFDLGCGPSGKGDVHDLSLGTDPDGVVAAFRAALASGSHLVICDFLSDHLTEQDWASHHELTGRYGGAADLPLGAAVRGRFDGLDLVEPGRVLAPDWCPDRPYDPPSGWLMAGIGCWT